MRSSRKYKLQAVGSIRFLCFKVRRYTQQWKNKIFTKVQLSCSTGHIDDKSSDVCNTSPLVFVASAPLLLITVWGRKKTVCSGAAGRRSGSVGNDKSITAA